ncbi:hypothetical protein [Planktomarina sp.]|uniref:hypothetical protein n=1 Tax=Planktomarina sp. TaxID=2024851 RepID=UPI003260533B
MRRDGRLWFFAAAPETQGPQKTLLGSCGALASAATKYSTEVKPELLGWPA